MENSETTTAAAAAQPMVVPRPRIANACEACRSAKVKCQASHQLGICKRCFDSKRECIFKTGPRTRRPRQSKNESSPRPPPPPAPSKTFTIDIPMPDEGVVEATEGIEALRLAHEMSIDTLVPYESSLESDEDDDMYDYSYYEASTGSRGPQQSQISRGRHKQSTTGSVVSNASSLPVGASALSTPPSSIVGRAMSAKKSLATIGIQPQFNADSAGALLESFRKVQMKHFPVIHIPDDATVTSLARERPFVLLAVLAAASNSRSLQGHSLYDEEFRKILGLKFVAGGERSVDLLLGLAIYVAWYPFHLRPKNKQAFQYIRMTVDLVSDLELDQDHYFGQDEPSSQRLTEIRAYLGSYYQVSSYRSCWARTATMTYTPFTSKCCDILEQHAKSQGDKILVWQVRLQRIVEETNDMRRNQRGRSQSESQIELMLKGMEAQLNEWEKKLDAELSNVPSIRIGFIFARIFLSGAPLLQLPSSKEGPLDRSTYFKADPNRLMAVISILQESYDYYLTLSALEINSFTGVHWSNFILGIILGFRMSFPVPVCPEWDDSAARPLLRFGEYIDRFCGHWGGEGTKNCDEIQASLNATLGTGTPHSGSSTTGPNMRNTPNLDILSASKVVLGEVRKKFLKRLAKHDRPPQQQQQQQPQRSPLPTPPAAATSSSSPWDNSNPLLSPTGSCPMMDGSLETFYPFFNESFSANMAPHAHPQSLPTPPFHDQPPTLQHNQHQHQLHPEQSIFHTHDMPVSSTAVPAAGMGLDVGGGLMGGAGAEGFNNDLWATMTMNWATQEGGFEF
ncbi:glucose transport transcription regulator RGT1 [Rhypophila sp. PSN 637]